MKKWVIAIALMLLTAARVSAAPVLPVIDGQWQAVTSPVGNLGILPFDNPSFDDRAGEEFKNIWFYAPLFGLDVRNAEYFQGRVTFSDTSSTEAFPGLTAHINNRLELLEDGGIRLTTDENRSYVSNGEGANNFLWFRWITPLETIVAMVYEDMFDGDFDGNDGGRKWRIPNTHSDGGGGGGGEKVPEPAFIAMLGMGLLGVGRRFKR